MEIVRERERNSGAAEGKRERERGRKRGAKEQIFTLASSYHGAEHKVVVGASPLRRHCKGTAAAAAAGAKHGKERKREERGRGEKERAREVSGDKNCVCLWL